MINKHTDTLATFFSPFSKASVPQPNPAFSLFPPCRCKSPEPVTTANVAFSSNRKSLSPSLSVSVLCNSMGNCNACVRGDTVKERNSSSTNHKKKKRNGERNLNPYSEDSIRYSAPVRVLEDIAPFTHRTRIGDKYVLGRELGRGEFGITYLCTDRENKESLACKSISKRKLRTEVDVEDVRREVAIMSKLPDHPNVVKLRETYEDSENVHLVMELCEGGELFDRIVARGHYSERAAASVARTIAEVVRMCHANGVMHRDLKPENFLFANKKERSPLKAIDFGLSVFFKPGMVWEINFGWF